MDVRGKLVELLKEVVAIQECGFGDPRPTCETVASYLISHGVTVQEWIPVTEQLPEDDPSVKKHIEGEKFGFLTVLVYNGVVKETNRFFCNEPRYGLSKTNGWEWASSNVTHWMPLPQPPEVTP